jgi:hypothetical protein
LAINIQNSQAYKPQDEYLKIFVMGDFGTGKSVFAGSFPGKGFVFNFDKKIITYRGKDFDYTEYPLTSKGWIQYESDMREVIKMVQAGKYETVIFDSTTAMGDLAMERALDLDPKRSTTEGPLWNVHYQMVRNIMEPKFRQLLSLECNVVVIAHLQLKTDDQGVVISADPMLTGQLAVKVPGYFEECYRATTQMKGGATEYVLQTITKGIYKARSGLSSEYRILPDYIPNTYKDVMDAYKKGVYLKALKDQKAKAAPPVTTTETKN